MNRAVGTVVLLVSALIQASSAAGTLPTYGTAQFLFNPNRPPVVSATADFNCDGLMDVIVANGDGSSTTYPVTILLADGHGSFVDGTSQIIVGSTHQTKYPSGIVIADFNGDGRPDVFIPDKADQSDGSAGYQNTLLLSTPDCHLTDGTAGIPQQQGFSWGAAAADVDGDGDVDLIVVNDWGPNPPVPMQLWLNDGSGHFSIAQGALPAAFTDVSQIGVIGYKASAFVDVNGDGFVDLVLGADFRTASSVVLLNDGSGRFAQLANAMPPKPFGTTDLVMDIKSADFNHDGKPDLVLAYRTHYSPRGRWLQILINNGDGTFRDETAQRLPQSDNTLTWFEGVDIVDIDGDGNFDLVGRLPYMTPGGGDHLFAVADPNGVFTPVSLVPGALDAVFSFVDVNGNGHRDFLSTYTNRVTLVPNTGPVLPPGIPQQVRATSMPDRVRLTWPYVWGATSYQVWRSASAGSAGSQIGTATSLTFDDLSATTTPMYYSVRAVNGAATSAASPSVGGSASTAPDVVTIAATAIGPFGATLNATVNPHGSSAAALFQYGYTATYGNQAVASAPGSATSPVAVSASVTGLSCNSTYHFLAKATDAGGIGTGADLTFTTNPCLPPTLRPYGAWVDLAWQPAGDVDYLIDKMVAAGVQNVRMAFRWYMFESVKGQWSFGVHDQIVAKLRAKGIEILGLIGHPPTWAQGGGPPGTTPPVDDSDWQEFISQIATHYRGQVANWEIWNEENLDSGWTPPPPDAVRYVQLLKIAFNTIRSADPNVTIVLGGLGDNGTFMGWEKPEERYYLQKIYDNGGKDYFDVLNVHIYVHPVTEGLSGLQRYLQDTHAVMAANGDAGKRLWLTETGWSLTPNGVTPNITETDQANLLTSIFGGRASLGLERIYWYSFRDMPTDADAFGMVRRDLTLRPSYYAYMGVTSSPPALTLQPQSQPIASSQTAILSVAATGAEPLTYQWYIGASGTTTNPIAGATGSSYTTPALTSTTGYWVRVSNANGTADSTTATMTVGTPPTITTAPQSQMIASGQAATLNVVATGTPPLTYQWYIGASGTTTNAITGATGASYTTPALTSATSYWVRVSNGYAPAADSATATISFGAPPVITTAPQSQPIASGRTATLSVVATGTAPLTYQWYMGTSGTTGNPIAGATGSSYTTPALTGTTAYWVRVSNGYPPAADSASATITVGTPPASTIVASGKSLMVTTANAVATFNGPDLVGFVNSLTNEGYLKNPSGGDLAVVDTITYTGQTLQASNWTVGVESGTGLPLATIASHDAVRTLTLTVKIDPASQEIVLRSSANVTTAGLRGASWSIAGLDLAGGRWIVPGNSGVAFDRAHPGLNTYLEYPYTWQAQMAVYEATLGSFVLYSTDSQFYFKQLRQTTRGDSALDVAVYTEATAPFPSATTVPGVEWRLKAFSGDWRVAAQSFRDWMFANRAPVSNAAHPWVSNIQTVVEMGGQDSSLLAPLAAQVNPSQTLLYLTNWRQSGYDVNYPDYTPGPGAASFIAAAHQLGFKVMLHTDLIGVAPGNPDYASVQQYQTRTPESLQLMGWNWDQPPSTPQRYGILDPAAAAFRSLWIARIGAAVATLSPDALHLDFTAMYNDGNGPIEGRTFTQGEDLFNQEIVAAFPNVALGAEEETDFSYRYHSFAQAGLDPASSVAGHPIVTFLFSPQVEYYGHLVTPEVSDPTFKTYLAQQQRRAVFPMWRVDQSSDLDTSIADNARFIGMVQSFQSHAFQPAWTTDWTGALVRYQGLAGSTAALTDTSTLMTLTASGTQLFQISHDANQVTTSSFAPFWPAFDGGNLYGLDPGRLYFLDSVPRPATTHVTSLPAGVQIGAGTLIGPTFAHVEVAPPPSSSFDFEGGLFDAHSGIRFQGVDTPLGNGAIVTPSSITAGGVMRTGIAIQPPYLGQVGGETFVEYSVSVPIGATMQFSVGIDDGAACTDGVTFRVTANGFELWHQNVTRTGWQDIILDLAAYGGSTVALRLTSNPGPANNPSCDWALWSQLSLGVAPSASSITVPLSLATGSVIAGFDGDGTVSSGAPLSATVASVPIPGAFTLFTQPGATVSSGTNLASLPFQVWGTFHGELAVPGGIFGDGTVGPATAGGVTKNSTIFAHPRNNGTTILSWVLRLPDLNALQLGLSVGLRDGAMSDDGVDFQVKVNGVQYWHLTTQADQWLPGSLDLTRWKGQNVLLELVTDSRANFNDDWAYWADLVLSASTTACVYSVPPTVSVGASGGSFSVNVIATPACSWSTVSDAPWLTITSGSGSGNGTVNYAVAPNPGPARTGVLTIAGQTATVTQAASTIVTNSPPTISSIAGAATRRNVPRTVSFTVGDLVGGAAGVGVSATSSNTALVPNANIVVGGAGADRSVTIVPSLNQIGATTITVTASARGLTATTSFVLVVNAEGPSGDFDGDGKADMTVFRPSTGIWYILQSSTTYTTSGQVAWGLSTDKPVPGDYDGDGRADVAVYRPSTGGWFILQSSSNYTTYMVVSWGVSTDVPVQGDYDGDGKADIAVYRPATGQWFILNSRANYTTYFVKAWGVSTDVPVPGDYDGDGKADIAVYRAATGDWYILLSSTNFTTYVNHSWGVSTDIPVVGDYDGDGKADIVVYRPSTGQWFILTSSSTYTTDIVRAWGDSTDVPLQGDYDGDGKADPAVYRPSTGQWFILLSSSSYTTAIAQAWGGSTDTPTNKQP